MKVLKGRRGEMRKGRESFFILLHLIKRTTMMNGGAEGGRGVVMMGTSTGRRRLEVAKGQSRLESRSYRRNFLASCLVM